MRKVITNKTKIIETYFLYNQIISSLQTSDMQNFIIN